MKTFVTEIRARAGGQTTEGVKARKSNLVRICLSEMSSGPDPPTASVLNKL